MGSRQETKEGTTVKDQWDLYRLRPSMGNSVLRVGGGGRWRRCTKAEIARGRKKQ